MRRVILIGAGVIALCFLCAVVLNSGIPSSVSFKTGTAVGHAVSPSIVEELTAEPEPTVVTIAAVGDVMCNLATLRSARYAGPGDTYDFNPAFASVAPYLSRADYTVCNLETRLAGPEYGYSSYPSYNSPGEFADALAACGVDLCATANNHALDKGWQGVVNTLDRLDEAGLAHVGTYRSPEERATPFIVDIKGVKVAFINYTDHLNDFSRPNYYAVNVVWKPEDVAAEAKAAREAGAEVVIALLHWGTEYVTKPNGKQVSWAEGSASYPGLLADGVDVILGAHPHVVQRAKGVRVDAPDGVHNAYVVYSMGNFLSNMDKYRTDSSVIVYVHITKTGEDVRVTGLSYMGVYMQQYGSYPRKPVIEPLLPGVVPAPGDDVSSARKRLIDSVWQYLTDMFYDPDMDIVPLDPVYLEGAG